IIDRDPVALSNPPRPTLFGESDAAASPPKAAAAASRLRAINSEVELTAHAADFSPRNAAALTTSAAPSVILDGTDNFATRLLINDVAVKLGVPFIYTGAVGTRAMIAAVIPRPLPHATACLRCLMDSPPAPGSVPTCQTAGILGPASMIAAAYQATQAIKVMLGKWDRLDGRLVEIDPWMNLHRSLDVGSPSDACPCCAQRRFDYLSAAAESTASLCGAGAVQVWPAGVDSGIDLDQVASQLSRHSGAQPSELHRSRFMLRAVLAEEPIDTATSPTSGAAFLELSVFPDGRAIVRGTENPARARSIYAKYLGG
ncbi:MAG: ThiF family adenylyltransferase, partial [Phycisphaerales bacterium]|nr:ThiF family adenylyltransferase [Phycisphaerales bacterium]